MSRRHTSFSCAGDTLAATIDQGDGPVGLLWIGGGNETRAGAFSGQAQLAAKIATKGHSVFRFDRRGVGDSSGENTGFTGSSDDIAAALSAFIEANSHIRRVIGFGNCDAASALMLQSGSGCDGLILSNPWTFETDDSSGADDNDSESHASDMPASAIRSRYLEKLKNPAELLRLFKGDVSITKLLRGVFQAMRPAPPPSSLAQDMASGLKSFTGDARILLASKDRTAQAFIEAWDKDDPRCKTCDGAGHAYAEPHARNWLIDQISAALDEQARQLNMD